MNIKAYENLNPIISVNRVFFDAVSLGGFWSDETRDNVMVVNIEFLKRK
jgi:hypothetical protein